MDDHTTETAFVRAELQAIRRRLDALAKVIKDAIVRLEEIETRTTKVRGLFIMSEFSIGVAFGFVVASLLASLIAVVYLVQESAFLARTARLLEPDYTIPAAHTVTFAHSESVYTMPVEFVQRKIVPPQGGSETAPPQRKS